MEINRSAWTLLDEGFSQIQQPATLISGVVNNPVLILGRSGLQPWISVPEGHTSESALLVIVSGQEP